SYMAQSDRLSGMASTSSLTVRYDYEPHLDVKTAVVNSFKERLISKYEYQYDRLGRRINVKNSGEVFGKDGFWLYGYNDRNEIATARRFVGADLKDQTQPIPDLERVYRFDPIGNRIEAVEGMDEIQYQTNGLNQYERISGPSQKEEALSYDEDGNLIEDSRFRYSWNAENRLVAVESKVAEAGAMRLEFVYDYMGRRIRKEVFTFVNGGYIPSTEICFAYDGWNMVKESKAEDHASVDKFYVWGLDLSQSLQGAGGVGGLLAVSDGAFRYSYMFDANGNVRQLIDTDTGIVSPHYEYDPFGKVMRSVSQLDFDEVYQFSSKYLDKESRLIYYGYRYYHHYLGRWIKKDPIGEIGGKNLYGFVKNAVMTYADRWGLVLVAVDGTDSRKWAEQFNSGRWSSHVRNFYEDYSLRPEENKRYWDGPDLKITGWDSFAIHKEVREFLMVELSKDRCQKINLVGHSRGGYIVMEIARELSSLGISLKDGTTVKPRVHFLGLYDAVDMVPGYGEDETIPSNVDYAAHAMGLKSVGSRPYFNTADHGPENLEEMIYYAEAFFDATHGGIGGDPWGGDHPFGMTKERDRIGSANADKWMRDQASKAGIFGGF
ncbi:MAG: RHS repeat-associated core domain-containing protein, partial [Desulfobacteraceae bacterium]|nr:RHS repeat-associated core domain-containing protein [Desulfobacteraceae bacterium]